MAPSSHPIFSHARCGFSLVELLVVVAIMTIFIAISAPAINSVAGSFQLDSAGQAVVGQLSLARQKALSSNRAIQIRFYYLPAPDKPPTSEPNVCRAMQVFVEGDPTASGSQILTPLTKTLFLPSAVIISTSESPNVSPLLPSAPLKPETSDLKLPLYQWNYRYASVRYKPDGSTDLDAEANSLTLVLQNDKPTGTTGMTRNYQTLRIDPLTGAVRVFQP